jgi:hypothetical protein
MQVVAPSSIIAQNIFLLRQPNVICNAICCERCVSLYSVSKEMMFNSEGSIHPMVDRKIFFYEGQLCNTSSVEMEHGVWSISSTIL